jgi:fibronectin type 3 domain-containing protein
MTIPSAPIELEGTAGNREVNLSWKDPEDFGGSSINEYLIYRSTSPTSGMEVPIATVQYGSNVFNDTTVDNDVIYYYAVSAVNEVGEGPNSNQISVQPQDDTTTSTSSTTSETTETTSSTSSETSDDSPSSGIDPQIAILAISGLLLFGLGGFIIRRRFR